MFDQFKQFFEEILIEKGVGNMAAPTNSKMLRYVGVFRNEAITIGAARSAHTSTYLSNDTTCLADGHTIIEKYMQFLDMNNFSEMKGCLDTHSKQPLKPCSNNLFFARSRQDTAHVELVSRRHEKWHFDDSRDHTHIYKTNTAGSALGKMTAEDLKCVLQQYRESTKAFIQPDVIVGGKARDQKLNPDEIISEKEIDEISNLYLEAKNNVKNYAGEIVWQGQQAFLKSFFLTLTEIMMKWYLAPQMESNYDINTNHYLENYAYKIVPIFRLAYRMLLTLNSIKDPTTIARTLLLQLASSDFMLKSKMLTILPQIYLFSHIINYSKDADSLISVGKLLGFDLGNLTAQGGAYFAKKIFGALLPSLPKLQRENQSDVQAETSVVTSNTSTTGLRRRHG